MSEVATPAAPVGEALVRSYAREAEMYRDLLFLAREQGGLLQRDEDVGRYAALFPRKDELLRSIGRIEGELEPLKRQWLAADAGAEVRARLNGLLDGLLGIIEAIREQEERNEARLCSRAAAARQAVHRARLSTYPPDELSSCAVACTV
ncbi:MAG TPA: hypothetical protein VNE39_19140 [Planctomycetota bacterium]|nr:hypothetical protein [Planctomycetota bacterium]